MSLLMIHTQVTKGNIDGITTEANTAITITMAQYEAVTKYPNQLASQIAGLFYGR